MQNPESLIENTQPKKPKGSKNGFESQCSHCEKTFKGRSVYDKHMTQQLCYAQNEISYCRVCNILLSSNLEYKKHLFTMVHLNNIGYNKLENMQTNEVAKIHLADPYLNSNDINKITKSNLGDSFTFIFEEGNTKTVSLINNTQNIQNPQSSQSNQSQSSQSNQSQSSQSNPTPIQNIQSSQSIQTPIQNIQSSQSIQTPIQTQSSQSIPTPIQNPPHIPTQRQQKIILILEKQTLETTTTESGKLFYKMLDTKFQIEDYKGLQTIINNLNIPNNYIETYLKVVEIFITMLVKEKTKGNTLYKDKDISQLVINLTS